MERLHRSGVLAPEAHQPAIWFSQGIMQCTLASQWKQATYANTGSTVVNFGCSPYLRPPVWKQETPDVGDAGFAILGSLLVKIGSPSFHMVTMPLWSEAWNGQETETMFALNALDTEVPDVNSHDEYT